MTIIQKNCPRNRGRNSWDMSLPRLQRPSQREAERIILACASIGTACVFQQVPVRITWAVNLALAVTAVALAAALTADLTARSEAK